MTPSALLAGYLCLCPQTESAAKGLARFETIGLHTVSINPLTWEQSEPAANADAHLGAVVHAAGAPVHTLQPVSLQQPIISHRSKVSGGVC